MIRAWVANPGGFSLVECMVAVLVLSIGLGGVAIQLLSAVRGTAEAQQHHLASLHAASLADLNRLGAGEDILANFRLRLARDIPSAIAVICHDETPNDGDNIDADCDGNGDLVVKLAWQDQRLYLPAW